MSGLVDIRCEKIFGVTWVLLSVCAVDLSHTAVWFDMNSGKGINYCLIVFV